MREKKATTTVELVLNFIFCCVDGRIMVEVPQPVIFHNTHCNAQNRNFIESYMHTHTQTHTIRQLKNTFSLLFSIALAPRPCAAGEQ